MSLNQTYKSQVPLSLSGRTVNEYAPAYGILNFSMTLAHNPWRLLGYVTNVLDKRAVLEPPGTPGMLENLSNYYVINRPRETGVRLFYTF